jgi:hypothetical protein
MSDCESIPFVDHKMLLDDAEERIAELEAENAELRKHPERLDRLHGPMVRFVRLAMRATFDGCDYDGGQMQDDLHRLGLLEEKTMTEPCGEICACADVGEDFPTLCYRIIPEFLEAEAALEAAEGDSKQ